MNRRKRWAALFGAAAPVGSAGPPTSSDVDVQAWITAIGASNTNQTEVNTLTTMVQGIKSDLAISTLNQKFDRFWIYALTTSVGALTDLAARQLSTNQGATLTAALGFTGDGSSTYVNSGFGQSTGTNGTQNANCVGVYMQAMDSRTATNYSMYGVAGASGIPDTFANKQTGTTQLGFANNDSNSQTLITTSQVPALYHGERTSSVSLTLYGSGVSLGTDGTKASAAFSALPFFILASNSNGTPGGFSNGTASAFYAGVNLGATQVANLYARVHTALHAISATNFP